MPVTKVGLQSNIMTDGAFREPNKSHTRAEQEPNKSHTRAEQEPDTDVQQNFSVVIIMADVN
ncbi:hypothetical protein BELL_1128g00010 [Botrytis elliptica]|uniref:Uncharacterized protein n=1 Tax=Botrytis elliptica TaxID=278938 RepID=A0A4Z1IL71_9HELO|nr:hypothetical protein BELL_1128g00010 [Botrytis elliptica]